MNISKETLITILAVLVLVVGGVYWYASTSKTEKDVSVPGDISNKPIDPDVPRQAAFSEWYENQPLYIRDCLRKALGNEFESASSDSKYEFNEETVRMMQECTQVQEKSDSYSTFWEFYESRGEITQECIKKALGSDFSKYSGDPTYEPAGGQFERVAQCGVQG